jgi:glycosyltransferase involved in cell wall biosynthesis
MPKVYINGEFLCNNLSGIERFAREITKKIDQVSQKEEIGIIIPKNALNVPIFTNLKVMEYGKDVISRILWQQCTLPGILKKLKAITVDFGNACSLFYPGITFLHDIYGELYPEDFTTKRERHERFYFRVLYRIIAYRAKKILTVSHFSKNQIAQAYHINPERIKVIYSSCDHFNAIHADYSVFNDFPDLNAPFYFSLGSLSKRKNLKWIVEYASKHPDHIFAISGMELQTVQVQELAVLSDLPNIILLGYLDDGKVKALMETCKAFILPSYYEGFGLTPLEALSCGAKIIVAKAASLPEIYGNAAYYIDPFNIDIDLDELLEQPVDPPETILSKYSYEKSARQLYAIIKEYTDSQ